MFGKFKFKPTVRIDKSHLIIATICLLLLCSLGFNITLTRENHDLNQRLSNSLNESTLASKNFNSKIEDLNQALSAAKKELKDKVDDMDLEVKAATTQAAKCLPLMKKYGIK